MFDWARGSMLKSLIDLQLYRATWLKLNTDWLKNWHAPWFVGLAELTPDMCVLDVGSAQPAFMTVLHRQFGCEVHALDAAEPATTAASTNVRFGFGGQASAEHPDVTMHVGFAGDDLLPAEQFDLVVCISTLEHTYDHRSPLYPNPPFPHLQALRDMVRMLKPGGVLFMNWDVFLDMMRQHVGWDFEADFAILQHCGLELLSNRRRLRGTQYLYDHPDTLFFDQGAVLKFEDGRPTRGTAINMLWRKPGGVTRLQLKPRPELEGLYFPPDETSDRIEAEERRVMSTDEIDARFRSLIARLNEQLTRKDIDGAAQSPGPS